MSDEEDNGWGYEDLINDAENDEGPATITPVAQQTAPLSSPELLKVSRPLSPLESTRDPVSDFYAPSHLEQRVKPERRKITPAFIPGDCLLGRPPLSGKSVSIILPDSSLWFLSLNEVDTEAKEAPGVTADRTTLDEHLSLLEVPVEVLLTKMDAASEQKIREPNVRNEPVVPPSATSAALWVDRYAPRGFLDLLSSDQINRNVLR